MTDTISPVVERQKTTEGTTSGSYSERARLRADQTVTDNLVPNSATIDHYIYGGQPYSSGDEDHTLGRMIDRLITDGVLSPGARGMSVEDALDQHAAAIGVDREFEGDFDDNEFPKVVHSDASTEPVREVLNADANPSGASYEIVVRDASGYPVESVASCPSCGQSYRSTAGTDEQNPRSWVATHNTRSIFGCPALR